MNNVVETANEYQKCAIRTLSDYGRDKNILHCVMGMAGESGEFAEIRGGHDRTKITAELGDCFWYAASLAFVLDMPFDVITREAELSGKAQFRRSSDIAVVVFSSRMLDQVKKTIFYGKKLDEDELTSNLILFVKALMMECDRLGITLPTVWTMNRNKLLARFPGPFSADQAINRNEEAEAKALEIKE